MKTGIELIADERQEQIGKHGYTLQHDHDEYDENIENGFDIIESQLRDAVIGVLNSDRGEFPAFWDETRVGKICAKPYKERLIIAGALIAAEIDRLQFVNQ